MFSYRFPAAYEGKPCYLQLETDSYQTAEGLAKALLAAITNLCLIYTNAPITEADVMLLKATIYAFFFVSACVDTSVYVKLLHLWFTEGPYTVVQKP